MRTSGKLYGETEAARLSRFVGKALSMSAGSDVIMRHRASARFSRCRESHGERVASGLESQALVDVERVEEVDGRLFFPLLRSGINSVRRMG